MKKANQEIALKVGDQAPVFSVPSIKGKIVLNQLLEQGPVVLALYPKDFTPGWSIEMKAFQSDIYDFEKLDAQVLGVSADTLQIHHEFAAELDLSFPLLADDGSISTQYGSGRVTYLLDRTSVIRMICVRMPDNANLAGEIGKL